MNRTVIVIVMISLAVMFFVVFLAARPIDDVYIAKEYLNNLGWYTSDVPVEYADVVLEKDSTVMLSYFEMQKENGFDLSQYDGKSVKRYTFRIKNHPSKSDVFANVLVYKGAVIGGDIMTRELDGFMKGLHRNGTS